MLNQIFKYFKKEYSTLNLIEISKQNLLDNYKYLSKLDKNLKVAPVVKSNAYGHGIQLVAKILDQYHTPGVEHEIPFFCVDSLYEAYELQKAKVKTPVLIMGYTDPENFKHKKLPFQLAVYDLETLEILNKYQPGAKVHLFIDTGLSREGISLRELDNFVSQIKQFPNITIEGIMSHLSSSESDKDKLFLNQVKNFEQAKEIFKKHKIKPKWVHLAASGALTNPKTLSIIAKISNLTRAGIALYGFDSNSTAVIPSEVSKLSAYAVEESVSTHSIKQIATSPMAPRNDKLRLKPVLTLTTKLVQIKTILKGEKVGYDGTFISKKDMQIGILPIGYNDGVDRRLSNIGVVTIQGKTCRILGKVSMNITTVDLTNILDAQKGDLVTIFSSNPDNTNSIQNCAKICKTIAYELLIHLDQSIKRIIV